MRRDQVVHPSIKRWSLSALISVAAVAAVVSSFGWAFVACFLADFGLGVGQQTPALSLVAIVLAGSVLATGTLFVCVFVMASRIVRAHRDKKKMLRVGKCRVCGYDLRATPNRCPECGAIPTQLAGSGSHHP
jgi:hypothetical protein